MALPLQPSKKLNPMVPQLLDTVVSKACDESDDNNYIYSREFKDKYKKTGDGEDDFVIEQVVEVTEKIDRQQYIDSFKDDVGILNILKKVELTGDVTLLNQRTRATVDVDENGREPVNDISNFGDQETARGVLMNVSQIIASLSPEMREAIVNMTPEQLNEYIASLNNKEGDNKDE